MEFEASVSAALCLFDSLFQHMIRVAVSAAALINAVVSSAGQTPAAAR